MPRHNNDYSWIDDPFTEAKDQGKMSGSSKAFIGIGCVVALVLIIVLVVAGIAGIANLATSL